MQRSIGLLWEYAADGPPLPAVGACSSVLDAAGEPRCVTATRELRLIACDAVDAQFAFDEGEESAAWPAGARSGGTPSWHTAPRMAGSRVRTCRWCARFRV